MGAVGGDQEITARVAAVGKPGGDAGSVLLNMADALAEMNALRAVAVQQHRLQVGARHRTGPFADAFHQRLHAEAGKHLARRKSW